MRGERKEAALRSVGTALVGIVMCVCVSFDAFAAPRENNMLSFDLDVVGGTAEYARRIDDNRLLGFGAGVDAAFLGYMVYAGRHFAEHDGWSYEEKDGYTNKDLLEILHGNLFIRHEALDRMHVDTGLRSSLFMHFDSSDDDAAVGIFAGAYVTVMYGWQRLKFGSRVQAGVFYEREGEFGVFLSPVIVRIALPW